MRPNHEGDEAGRCGGCGSRAVEAVGRAELGMGACLECGRLQESEGRDWPESEMCNNCAFRVGSPERADPYRWVEIEETLQSGPAFHCHKGLAFDVHKGRFSPPNPATGRVTVCAGWLSAYVARLKKAEKRAADETARRGSETTENRRIA